MKLTTPLLLWASSLLLCAASAVAQVVPATSTCPIPKPDEAIANYQARAIDLGMCLGTAGLDPASLTNVVTDILKPPPTSEDTRALGEALDRLLEEADSRSTKAFDVALWRALSTELVATRAKVVPLSKLTDHAQSEAARRDLVPGMWKTALVDGMELGGVTFDLIKPPPECESDKPCAAFESRVAAIRLVRLMVHIDAYAESPQTLGSFAEGRVRVKRWEAYREKAHSLYWWEVFVNGALMESSFLGSDGTPPCKKDSTGTSLGFCEVPTKQLILLHPDAALRFSRTANKASELKPALMIELVGLYWWDWAGPTSAELKGRRGTSLAASYTSTDKEAKLGYGLMFHINDYSFAVTKASLGKWSLVVSVPLAGEVFGRREAISNELSKVKKSSFLDLLTN